MATDEQLIEQFKIIDADGNGVLSGDEVRKILEANGYHEQFIRDFIQMFDSDNDGKITYDEYQEKLGIIPDKEKSYSAWRKVFRDFDKDHSGKISATELQQILGEQNSNYEIDQLKNWISQRDTDGDGQLDYEEFLEFIRNH